MKKVIVVLLTTFVCTSMSAQTYWDGARADKLFTFGVRCGVDFSRQYDTERYYTQDLRHRLGFHIGAEVDWNICRSFSANLGLKVIQKGFKADFSNDENSILKENNNATYLEIPICASYRIALSDNAQFQINIGPYFAYGICGKSTTEYYQGKYESKDEIDSFDDYDGLKRFDFGLCYGCAITLSHFYVGVNYEHSLRKLGQDSRNDAKNSSIVISLGYNFN